MVIVRRTGDICANLGKDEVIIVVPSPTMDDVATSQEPANWDDVLSREKISLDKRY